MIRSILVALDDGAGAAQRLAMRLAVERGASLFGVAIVDLAWLTRGEAVPVGASYYRLHRDTERLQGLHHRNDAVRRSFIAAATRAGVVCETGEIEGDPAEMLRATAELHDMVVIGHDAAFHPEPQGAEASRATLSEPARCLVAAGIRPVLVVPDRDADPGRILVATDGSAPAWRALHLFALLGLAEGREATVLSVAADRQEAQARADRAARLLAVHGAKPTAVGIASRAHPADIVASQAEAMRAGILVMGAHGHQGLGEFLFGSTTQRLLQACPAALFVHR